MTVLQRMNAWAERHPIPRWFLVTWWVFWIAATIVIVIWRST